MENKLVINVYDENDNILKTSEAHVIDLRFGTIRALMKLIEVDDINDTAELMKTVLTAWAQVTAILGRVFPDIQENEWDNVKLGELIPVLITILKSSFVAMLAIPADKDSKN